MPPTTTAPARGALTLSAWRDYDEDACALPGMSLGAVELTGPPEKYATRLWELGARRVRLADPVDLTAVDDPDTAAHAVRQLCLVRDLTARAVLVEWHLRLPPQPDDGWRDLSHLQPPRTLTGPADPAAVLTRWRDEHYLCKCLWRQGPGFVQIRDRRRDHLELYRLEDPAYIDAIAALRRGEAGSVPAAVLRSLTEAGLVVPFGERHWWAPCRLRRWPVPAWGV